MAKDGKVKLACFVLPHVGGTYSVFKSLHVGLADYGIDVRWISRCDDGYELPAAMRAESSLGELLKMPKDLPECASAKRMVDAITNGDFDGVIVNVLGDKLETNIARYLPEHLLRILIVHNITPGTYSAAKAIRDYAHATVGVSERSRSDLVEGYGFPAERTHVIANAVDTTAFNAAACHRRRSDSGLHALFVGRIEDASKGVLWLREILDALPESISLTIVGDGPDMHKLKRRLANHGRRVQYLGALPAKDIPPIMAGHDVLIMPSRFEGLPVTLIEAMAAGCVPVASHIRGVTDTVIDSGKSGMLFPVGNHAAAANAVTRLHRDRRLLESMSVAARETVSRSFGLQKMADRYHDVIATAVRNRPKLAPVLAIDEWAIPQGLRPGLRTYVPLPIKNWLRVIRERL